ncbi:Ribonuclease III protein [Rutstroemia sp. NJR-2017a WRK4]|nr:Ribonuclease III protein [Rutstroemia sp. NJR-2017a WRK4]
MQQMCPVADTRTDEKKLFELKIFFFAIASSRSLIVLRKSSGYIADPLRPLLLYQEVVFVRKKGSLGGNMAYSALLRRCHIHELVIDRRMSSERSNNGFIVNTMQSVSSEARRKPGNPGRIDDAEVSRVIMKALHPDVEPDSLGYKQAYSVVSKLRKLGQRLNLLTAKFGHGILGLLPLATDVLADSGLNISDGLSDAKFIRNLSILDKYLRNFVQHLDVSLGSLLRQMSTLVDDIVVKILERTIDHSKRFAIEDLEPDQIIEHPRGSPELLRLIYTDVTYEVYAESIQLKISRSPDIETEFQEQQTAMYPGRSLMS